jgi:hypothetical protein
VKRRGKGKGEIFLARRQRESLKGRSRERVCVGLCGSVQLIENSERERERGMAEIDSFEALKLPPWLLKQCKALNFSAPTPVQSNCVLPALEGKERKTFNR